MSALRRFWSDEQGQTATEYMLALSVIVIAIVAASWPFVPAIRDGLAIFGKTFGDFFGVDGGPCQPSSCG